MKDKIIKEKTLKKMKETRKEDSIMLRNKIEKEIERLTEQYKTGQNKVQETLNFVDSLKKDLLKIQGAIQTMKQMLKPEEEIKKEEK